MRRAAGAIALIVGCCAPCAGAQSLRIFLAAEGLADPADPTSPLAGPPTLAVPTLGAVGAPARAYLWAAPDRAADQWHAISLGVRTRGLLRLTSIALLDADPGAGRWDRVRPGAIAPDGRTAGGVALLALPGLTGAGAVRGDPPGPDPRYDPATAATLIGWIEVTGAGAVFLEIGDLGVCRAGGAGPPGDTVWLGFGDEGAGLRGGDVGAASPAPDLLVEGCPADLTGDGALDLTDFLAFQSLFAAGDLRADFDLSGQLDLFDFLSFQTLFAAGCP
ncbi:MAG: GC-type dockerin domain-anchored protein [Phycisphaerales bacterium JB039]